MSTTVDGMIYKKLRGMADNGVVSISCSHVSSKGDLVYRVRFTDRQHQTVTIMESGLRKEEISVRILAVHDLYLRRTLSEMDILKGNVYFHAHKTLGVDVF